VRARVVVPLLFALAAALGLVVGAVLPNSSSTSVAVDDAATPGPGPDGAVDPTDASAPSDSATPAPSVGEVTGAGGGASAVNLPQPEFPIEKLAPGETPPQFVVVSFDGAGNDAVFHQFMDTADATGAKYTFFVSSVYLLPDEMRYEYTNPGRQAGDSGIGFGGTVADVAGRVENYREAYEKGHEIGTHFGGHYCQDNTGSVVDFSQSDWMSEVGQAKQFINDWAANTGTSNPNPLPFNGDVYRGGRTPCLEGDRALMYPAFVEQGFTYDASNTGFFQWPVKNSYGLWDFPLPTLKIGDTGRSTIAMDYNIYFQATDGALNVTDPAQCAEIERVAYDTLMNATQAAYDGTRAPLIWGMHWAPYACGAFIDATIDFVETASATMPDVRFVTFDQLAQWLDAQDPAVLAELQARGPQAY
jgi:hypothetical protein